MSILFLILVFAVAVIFSMLGLSGGVLYVSILLQSGLSFHHAVPNMSSLLFIDYSKSHYYLIAIASVAFGFQHAYINPA